MQRAVRLKGNETKKLHYHDGKHACRHSEQIKAKFSRYALLLPSPSIAFRQLYDLSLAQLFSPPIWIRLFLSLHISQAIKIKIDASPLLMERPAWLVPWVRQPSMLPSIGCLGGRGEDMHNFLRTACHTVLEKAIVQKAFVQVVDRPVTRLQGV